MTAMRDGARPAPGEIPGRWVRFLEEMHERASLDAPLLVQGTLVRVTGLVLEVVGIRVPVGSLCEVLMPGQPPVQAEVVGFTGDRAFLMPAGEIHGLAVQDHLVHS